MPGALCVFQRTSELTMIHCTLAQEWLAGRFGQDEWLRTASRRCWMSGTQHAWLNSWRLRLSEDSCSNHLQLSTRQTLRAAQDYSMLLPNSDLPVHLKSRNKQ